MSQSQFPNDRMKGTQTFFDELFAANSLESDRGYVICATAMIDELLLVLLRSAFSSDPYTQKHAVGPLLNDGMAPIGSLSARIKLALALGLIDQTLFKSLNNLRKIRNKFAHERSEHQLSDQDAGFYIDAALEGKDGVDPRVTASLLDVGAILARKFMIAGEMPEELVMRVLPDNRHGLCTFTMSIVGLYDSLNKKITQLQSKARGDEGTPQPGP